MIMEEELSDFEKKAKTIWKEFVDDPDVRVEQVSKKAQENVSLIEDNISFLFTGKWSSTRIAG